MWASPRQLRGQVEENLRQLGRDHLDVTGAQLAEAQSIAPVVCVQNRFGIGAPAAERELLRSCGAWAVAYVPYFAIAGDGRPLARALRSVRTCWPWRGPMARAPRRSGWPGARGGSDRD